jgi:hypothetical protein
MTPIVTIQPIVGLASNTAMFNVTEQLAMTMPVDWLPAKEDPNVYLPTRMQIVGGMWQDGKVLRAGYVWEQKLDWKGLKPEVKGMKEFAKMDFLAPKNVTAKSPQATSLRKLISCELQSRRNSRVRCLKARH